MQSHRQSICISFCSKVKPPIASFPDFIYIAARLCLAALKHRRRRFSRWRHKTSLRPQTPTCRLHQFLHIGRRHTGSRLFYRPRRCFGMQNWRHCGCRFRNRPGRWRLRHRPRYGLRSSRLRIGQNRLGFRRFYIPLHSRRIRLRHLPGLRPGKPQKAQAARYEQQGRSQRSGHQPCPVHSPSLCRRLACWR